MGAALECTALGACSSQNRGRHTREQEKKKVKWVENKRANMTTHSHENAVPFQHQEAIVSAASVGKANAQQRQPQTMHEYAQFNL